MFASPADSPGDLYKLTNLKALHFDDSVNGGGFGYDFHTYPTVIGRYSVMQARPGTCAENLSTPDHDKLHVIVMSLRDKEHKVCIDDSTDVWCGDGSLQPDVNNDVRNNREVCDDGNNVDGDGCSADCKTVETGWVCTDTIYTTSVCTYQACGNGVFDNVDA